MSEKGIFGIFATLGILPIVYATFVDVTGFQIVKNVPGEIQSILIFGVFANTILLIICNAILQNNVLAKFFMQDPHLADVAETLLWWVSLMLVCGYISLYVIPLGSITHLLNAVLYAIAWRNLYKSFVDNKTIDN